MPSVKAMQKARMMIPELDQHNSHLAWRGGSIETLATVLDECDALQISFETARQLVKEANESLDEQARAFSDVAREAQWVIAANAHGLSCNKADLYDKLAAFILPEPEPDVLADAIKTVGNRHVGELAYAEALRAEIARRGGLTIPGDAK